MSKKLSSLHYQQQGFTLLELLVAVMLMLMVVVGVQRFIAGVAIDEEGISDRHEQVIQTRIALSNMQRDVAQAGYYPLSNANSTLFTAAQKDVLGVSLSPCAGTDCVGQRFSVGSVRPIATAVDCNGASAWYTNGTAAMSSDNLWVIVHNQYIFRDNGGGLMSLVCEGNGGKDSLSQLDGIVSARFSTVSNGDLAAYSGITEQNLRLVSLCLITQGERIAYDGSATAVDCNGKALSPVAGQVFYKTRIDMAVYAKPFIAGK